MSEVTAGQAAKAAGVPTDVLRELGEAGKVRARMGERGVDDSTGLTGMSDLDGILVR